MPTAERQQLNFKLTTHRGATTVQFDRFANHLQHLPPGPRVYVVDEAVWGLYPAVRDAAAGHPHLTMVAHEENKTLAYVTETLLPWLTANKVNRATTVVVIGGGIVQDAVSFACSILMRGVPWVLYPTTLLAQADSCIGSKTSINYQQTKNTLGTFYPAAQVVVDSDFIATLAEDDVLSGFGEMVKVHLLAGPQHWAWLTEHAAAIVDRDDAVLAEAIARSLDIKRGYAEQDEFDTGVRNQLNYGHCFGHAIEAATDYAVSHGMAVLHGIVAADFLAVQQGWLAAEVATTTRDVLAPYLRQPEQVQALSFAELVSHLKRDKKREGDYLSIIISRAVGDMVKQGSVTPEAAEAAWQAFGAWLGTKATV